MRRRDFLKQLSKAAGVTSIASFLPWSTSLRAEPYTGPFYVTIAAQGGWDVSSFCDPKENSGGQIINHWSSDGGTVQTLTNSAIRNAPFADNSRFFQKYRDYMLVVNGIDAQTNAHDAGVRHNWSGQLAAGYPSFNAIASTIYGNELPLAFISNGGYKETAGLTTYTLLQDPSTLQSLVNSNRTPAGDNRYFYQDELDIVYRYQQERLERLLAEPTLLPKTRRHMNQLLQARVDKSLLENLAAVLPTDLVDSTDKDGHYNPLLQQAQMSLAAYQSGLCVCADMILDGFDSHDDHDARHVVDLTRLTNGIDYLWDSAEALGIADRLVVFITSDFSRTPYYNDGNGKDHWPIGSAIFMKKNADWGNRVIGATDNLQNAQALNPFTLQVDTSTQGIQLYPAHIQQALRALAGIHEHEIATQFPLNADLLDMFNPALGT